MELNAKEMDEKTAERKKKEEVDKLVFQEERFKADLKKMADAAAKDGEGAKKRKMAEMVVINSLKAYEDRVKQGYDAHEEFKKDRSHRMSEICAKSHMALEKVREQRSGDNLEVLYLADQKFKRAHKNKEKAMKEFKRDREDKNDT